MLKANSKKTLDIYQAQKKKNATQAYMQTHPEASIETAKARASELLAKPEAKLYLDAHIDKAKQTIVSLMDSEKDDIRLRASTDILDRSHGKAVSTVVNQTTGIMLSIDLTSALDTEEQ